MLSLTTTAKHRNAKSRPHRHRQLMAETLEDRRLLTFVPPGLSPGDTYHLVFACSTPTDQMFGSATGGSGAGDTFIQSCANSSPLTSGGFYAAIISDGLGRNANALIPSGNNVPIYNTGGQLVATDYANLWQGAATNLVNEIGFDEGGNAVVPFSEVWTGTDNLGFHKQSGGNWTANPSLPATIGVAAGAGANSDQWIDVATNNFPANQQFLVYGVSEQLTVEVGCDLNGDLSCDIHDADLLVAGIVADDQNPDLDFNGDGDVNGFDMEDWLLAAGEVNLGPGRGYLPGDGDLDGFVDGSDFLLWNSHKFTPNPFWSKGDWNYDGVVDGSDFLLWNVWKFSSSDNGLQNASSPADHHADEDDSEQSRERITDLVFAGGR